MSRQDVAGQKAPSKRPFTTLLGENVGRDYAEYTDGLGAVRLWHFGNRIGVFESSGGIVADHARFVVDYHKRFVETHPRPHYTFGNWSNLRAYTADVRKILTDWQIEKAYDELHVSHNSHLLAMSISVANAALKGTIQVHPTEEKLDDVLGVIRKRHGL